MIVYHTYYAKCVTPPPPPLVRAQTGAFRFGRQDPRDEARSSQSERAGGDQGRCLLFEETHTDLPFYFRKHQTSEQPLE